VRKGRDGCIGPPPRTTAARPRSGTRSPPTQRYLEHFPAAGEIVIFDGSWYNRAGVEYVMGFCTKAQHRRFLVVCPEFERYVVADDVLLIEYWREVSEAEQKRRFEGATLKGRRFVPSKY
jgi:polyphosphate kinase 2 (PPK2 family)